MDGKLIASFWSFRQHGIRTFSFQGHEIEVRVKIGTKGVFSEGYVDGELRATNLFSEFNAKVTRKRGGPPPMIKVAIWVVLALLFFAFFKKVDAKSNTTLDTETAHVSVSKVNISSTIHSSVTVRRAQSR